MIFGSENGEHDTLLFNCPVHISVLEKEHRIFTGRWGTGKSAHLFLANEALTKALEKFDKRKRKLWYLDENSLDVGSLNELRANCNDTREFRFQVERIWKAEVLRAAASLLGFVAEKQPVPNTIHWKFVKAAYTGGQYTESLWSNIKPLMKIVFGDDARFKGVTELHGKIEDLATQQAEDFIQKCIADLDGHFPKIAIGVEPIDTPKSPLESADKSMAQDVIASLLNVFLRSFQPDETNLLDVYLAIPWHRYTIDGVINPQKRRAFEAHLSWEKHELHKFINSRIAWEFNRVRRSFKSINNAWDQLYVDFVPNTYCNHKFLENSFNYILRHTHHRPRDVQRICRLSLKKCAAKTGRSIDDIISGKSGLRVDASHIRDAVLDYCSDHLIDFQEEVRRRFPDMPNLEAVIRGISVPFSLEELESRAKRFGIDVGIDSLFRELWEAGFVGIEASIKENADPVKIATLFSECAHVIHKIPDGKTEFHRWYLFSYNTKGDPLEIFTTVKAHPDIGLMCVLHPRTFERFSRHLSQKWPIGV